MVTETDDTRVSIHYNSNNISNEPSILNNYDDLETESDEFIEAYISSRSNKLAIFLRYLTFLFLFVILPGIPLLILILFNKKSYFSRLLADPFDDGINPKLIFLRLFTYICSVSILIGLFSYLIDIIPRIVHKLIKRINKQKVEKTKLRLEFYIALISPIKISLSVIILLVMWVIVYHGSNDFEAENSRVWFVIVFKLLLCLCIATLTIALEKFILQLIAIKFHHVAYKERIKEMKNSTKVLDALSNARKNYNSNSEKKSGNKTYNSMNLENLINSPGCTPRLNEKLNIDNQKTFKGSQISSNSGPNTPGVPGTHEKIFNSKFSKKLFDGNMWHEETDLNSKYHAKKLAKKLFDALNNQRNYLIVEDFYPFFETKKQAVEAFAYFDIDGNGDVSKREMKERIMGIYKERKDLSTSLRDINSAVGKLDKILITVFCFVIGLVWAIVFGKELTSTLVPFGTFMVAISFVFGPSAKNLFESIIFIFVVHPYDTGDRIYIGEENYVVERFGLLSTTFIRADGQVIYYPNTVLMTKSIQNIRRSTSQAEQVDFHISFDTPKEKILTLKTRFCEYINSEETRDFFPDPLFAFADIESCNKLKFFIWLEHKGNWQDGGKRWSRKSRVMMALKEIATGLGINYELPPQKIATVGKSNCVNVLNAKNALPNSEARDYFSSQN